MAKISAKKTAFEKLGGGFAIGINALGAYGDYKESRQNGSSRLGSAAYAAGNFALYEALGGWAIPFNCFRLSESLNTNLDNCSREIAPFLTTSGNRRVIFSIYIFDRITSLYISSQEKTG